jgi:hypothetical protein
MTSLTAPHCRSTNAVSPEGSGFPVLAPLDPDVCRDMRWCIRRGGQEVFVEVFECEHGRVGVCLGCGEEKLIPFSREVAA